MPVVTVPSRPSGDPTAITGWPTRIFSSCVSLKFAVIQRPSTGTTAISS